MVSPVMPGSVTRWLDLLRQGKSDTEKESAVEPLWRRFFSLLVSAAESDLAHSTRRVYDEEDAALSGFYGAVAALIEGRYLEAVNRESLWRLLLASVQRKIRLRSQYDAQASRDASMTLTEDGLEQEHAVTLDDFPSRPLVFDLHNELAETLAILLASITDDSVRSTAMLKLEGCSDSEVAKRLNCSRRTVQRRLEITRRHWRNQFPDALSEILQ